MIGVEHPKRLATLLELLQVDGDRVARGSGDVGDVELFQARAVSLENKNTSKMRFTNNRLTSLQGTFLFIDKM